MRNRSIFVELTSLLDVILIIMFLILMQTEERANMAYSEAKEEFTAEIEFLKEEVGESIAEKDKLTGELESLKTALEGEGYFILISLQSAEKGRDIRTILVEAHGKAVEQIDLVWDKDTRNDAFNLLGGLLSSRINESNAQMIFIVFKFDSTNIFEDDHRMIKLAIQRQKLYNSHVYTAEIDLKENNR